MRRFAIMYIFKKTPVVECYLQQIADFVTNGGDIMLANGRNIKIDEEELMKVINNHYINIVQTLAAENLSMQLVITICISYRTVPSTIWPIFSEFLIFCRLIKAKYEKRGKYWPYCAR